MEAKECVSNCSGVSGLNLRDPLCVDETRDVIVGRMMDEIIELPLLHDLAFAEHHDVVSEESSFSHIVRDHDGGLGERSKDLQEIFLKVESHERIECAHRFIEQEDGRIEHQGSHDADSLSLATRHLCRITLQSGLW